MAARKPECPVRAYAEFVLGGTVPAGRLVRLACERHLRDLEEGPARGLRWDADAAAHVLQFAGFLKLPDGDGETPFRLQPFQQFILGSLFGWKGSDGYRRFRTGYVEMGKGSGKTPLAAIIGLYGLTADGEAGAEIYSAATSREQAGICFRDARLLAEASPALARQLKIDQHNLAYLPRASFFRPISAEHRGLDGKRPHMALIDEVHEHPTALVVDKMRAGTKGRRQAIVFEITNSGHDRTTVCWQHREYSTKVLEGVLQDDSWFAYVCQLDACMKCRAEGKTQPTEGCPECDQWDDEKVWLKANPGLETILPAKYLREQVREAKGMPAKEAIVKRLNFCIWTEVATRAIPMDKWDLCADAASIDDFQGRECFGGLDIGATSDFTAFPLLFPHDDAEALEIPAYPKDPDGPKRQVVRRGYHLFVFLWLPERPRKRDARMQAMIDLWKRQGYIRTTPGEVVDYDLVLEDIVQLSERFGLRKIAFDRGFQGSQMGTNLMNRFGAEMVVSFPQGIISMNAPFRELLELLITRRLRHDGNPVLRWMASNVAAEQRGGLIKPSKEHSAEKIDGITAAVMALGVAMTGVSAGTEPSITVI